MENIKLDFTFGSFNDVARKAQNQATNTQNVEFEFNGITCIVSKNTNLDNLFRDYINSWDLGWNTVGYDCVEEYPQDILTTLQVKKEEREKESDLQIERLKSEKENKLNLLNSQIGNVEFNCVNTELLQDYIDKNKDDYGAAIIDYAKTWGRLMQFMIQENFTLKVSDVAESTSFQANVEGITGFMYGIAVKILSDCWIYGNDLKNWHNQKYNYSGNEVINPAIITINGR